MRFRPLLLVLLVHFVIPAVASAQWAQTGTIVSAVQNDQRYISVCSDGAGGAIVAWEDLRVDTGSDLYMQRISAAGVPQWTANGVAICTLTGAQWQPRLISDGAGGAVVTWMDGRGGPLDIYAQRVNASGATLWTANGVVVCNAVQDQQWPSIVSDGGTGAIITWYDGRGPTPPNGYDIYAQKLNSSGVPQWTANGVAVCTAAQDQTYPQIASNGSGGAIITWQDYRAGTAPLTYDVQAQNVLTTGSTAWTSVRQQTISSAYRWYPTVVRALLSPGWTSAPPPSAMTFTYSTWARRE